MILAVVLGGIEGATDRTVWRNPRPEHAVYLGQLAEWGYPLSDVEHIVTDAAKPKAKRSRRVAKVEVVVTPVPATDADPQVVAVEGEAEPVA